MSYVFRWMSRVEAQGWAALRALRMWSIRPPRQARKQLQSCRTSLTRYM